MFNRHLVKVSGDSMSPLLADGEYAVMKKPRVLRPGQIYVVSHIDLGLIVKRLKSVENGRCIFEGVNPASTPASLIAPVDPDRIKGHVVFALGPKGIRRV